MINKIICNTLSLLNRYKLPISAINSIFHRLTGIILSISLPFLLWCLSVSLKSQNGFDYIRHLLVHFPHIIISWSLLSLLSCHILSGVRHIIMDFGFLDSLYHASLTSYLVFLFSIAATFFWGIWLWMI